jgi:endo-1,4-beta-xylanase
MLGHACFSLELRRLGGLIVMLSSLSAACLLPRVANDAGGQAPASGSPKAEDEASAREGPALRQVAASTKRRIGTAVATWHFNEAKYKATAAREFDSLTPENEMKWEAVEPQPDQFSFRGGDALVAFAEEHGMRVRGHTLVWHSQLAPWVKSLSGDDLRAAMIRHVKTVAGHWKGKIAQWDVVNEALTDAGELRGESPFTALGPEYLDAAFRAAHEADPDALLFYNDYEIEAPGARKTEAAFGLVKRLKESGVPIHGIGFQMHVDPRRWPTPADIRENFQRFAALGLFIEITEMDVPVGEMPGSRDDKLAHQKALTHDIVAACLSVEKCSGITVWGVVDKYSWLADPKWGKLRGSLPHDPLPFDDGYRAKPMHAGIADAFAGR